MTAAATAAAGRTAGIKGRCTGEHWGLQRWKCAQHITTAGIKQLEADAVAGIWDCDVVGREGGRQGGQDVNSQINVRHQQQMCVRVCASVTTHVCVCH
jgi:hypothetical protein